jgi:hypothetical protein
MSPEEQELEDKLNGNDSENIDYEPDEPQTEGSETPDNTTEDEQVVEEQEEESVDLDDDLDDDVGAAIMSPEEVNRLNRLKDWSERR